MSDELTERLRTLTAEDFAPHLNTDYRVLDSQGGELTVRLSEVTPVLGGAQRNAFALLFLGPLDVRVTQGTFRFVHSEMGELDLFIVPIGPKGGGMGYEAIFT